MSGYGNSNYSEPIDRSHYTVNDICNGLIVDVTAEQFGEDPMYVGEIYDFYRMFEFRAANDYAGLGSTRLRTIYKSILSCL